MSWIYTMHYIIAFALLNKVIMPEVASKGFNWKAKVYIGLMLINLIGPRI